MKTILSEGPYDFILDETEKPVYGPDGKFVQAEGTDEHEFMIKCRGHVENIEVFLPVEGSETQYVKVQLSAYMIKKLNERILDVEKRESNQFWD